MSDTLPSISTLLQQASQQLEKLSDSPLLDAQLLLADILKKDRSYLMAWPEVIPNQQETELFQSYLLQRKEEIPVAYILGYKEFWSMPFKVTPDVLIPRPETELLVEQVLEATSHLSKPKILELGTGSGAIAIALGKELPKANITATDLSEPALRIATENAHNLRIDNIHFLQSDWFVNIEGMFDVIVSNPPYIENEDPHLTKEIRHEPKQALVSGKDGLDAIKIIINAATDHLNKDGMLFIEHGYNQGINVCTLMQQSGFTSCKTIKDLSANDRVTLGAWQPNS